MDSKKLIQARSILTDAMNDAYTTQKINDKLTCLKFGYAQATKLIPDASQKVDYLFYDVYELQQKVTEQYQLSVDGSPQEKRLREILASIVRFLQQIDETAVYKDDIIVFTKGGHGQMITIDFNELNNLVQTYKVYLDRHYKELLAQEAQSFQKFDAE